VRLRIVHLEREHDQNGHELHAMEEQDKEKYEDYMAIFFETIRLVA